MENKPEIGLVLSGGGVRGAAHIGLLKVLEAHGLEPTRLAGSSAGAMVGALYAAGYKPDEILDFFRKNTNDIFKWTYFSRRKPGILDAEKYAEMFSPWLSDFKTFEDLHKELHICVTDVLQGRVRFFSSGELVRPILASAAIPGVFTPVEIGEDWYVDGGTMNNFPVEPLIGRCDWLIGSFVSPKQAMDKSELTNTLKLLDRASDLAFLAASISKFGLCDFIFTPPELANYGTFDSKKVDEIYEIGYRYASEKIGELLAVMGQKESEAAG
ncbi:MAG: hypothetical protein D6714_02780 [Bacteroidetes bacterium]|nr:MAG: hypothetical protein D6714_02780 [Bacteroidota bacterium]